MKPVQVSIWNGIVMGGGVGISVHAPIRIATEKSVFAMPETGIGFFTDVGGSYFLSRLNGNECLGTFLGVTGHRLKSKDLLKWGVATNYIETDKLEGLYKDVNKAASSTTSLEEIKEIVDSHSDNKIDGDKIPEDTINYCFKPDSMKQIYLRLKEVAEGKKSSDDKALAEKWLKNIGRFSPISCSVVVEQIRRGKNMSLSEVFEMEYKISQGFMESGEFYEGVRALLIDKDNSPKWKHSTVEEVNKSEIDFFFDRSETLNLDLKGMYRDGIKF